MAIEFTNRKEDTYYIKERKTKTGKTTYTMTKTKSAACVEEVPQGFEVHEKPENGMMVIRKKIPSKYSLKEVNIIKTALQKNDTITDFKIDIKGNELSIYTTEVNSDSIFAHIPLLLRHRAEESLRARANYTPMMKIIISKETPPEYEIQRFCFRGSVDDWIPIGVSNKLKEHIKKYSYHLGKESFYELNYNYGE